jgi:hypothetical protein
MNSVRVGLCVALPLLIGCEHLNFSRGEQPPERPPSCFVNEETLKAANWDVDGPLEERMKAAFGGVLALEATVQKLNERLRGNCEHLERELRDTREPSNATTAASNERRRDDAEEEATPAAPYGETNLTREACSKATTQIKAFKEQHSVAVSVNWTPYYCGARTDDFAACARRCDKALPPGKLAFTCDEEQRRGRCTEQCSGECAELNATDCAATCSGECNGACSSGFFGKCGGKCVGTCDMANVNGKCEGMCHGKCLSDAKGSCEGKCTGKCIGACLTVVKAKRCTATCRGECNVSMVSELCSQVYPPPEMSEECVARCAAETTTGLQCSVDHMNIEVLRADKDSDGLRFRNVLGSRLREIVEISEGRRPPLENASGRVGDVLEAVKGDLEKHHRASRKAAACLAEAQERNTRVRETFAQLNDMTAEVVQTARD